MESFNALLRLLLQKIPSDQLVTFIWRHVLELELETLLILLTRQLKSLVCLDVNEECQWWSDRLAPCLESLAINFPSAEATRNDAFHYVFSRTNRTLKSLAIGFEKETIRAYEKHEMQAYSGAGGLLQRSSAVFTAKMADAMKMQQRTSKAVVSLRVETLRLSSFDLYGMLRHPLSPFVDFTRLTSLQLESCSGLEDGLEHFTSDRGRQDSPLRLRSLAIRTELGSARLCSLLESFVCSLSNLVNLSLLYEGYPIEKAAEHILTRNGEKLKTLVLEGRFRPRTVIAEGTSLIPNAIDNLSDVAEFCPNLVELGLNIDWMAVSDSNTREVAVQLQRLENLKVLNIRNMPEAEGLGSSIPVEPMLKGLATSVADLTRAVRRPPMTWDWYLEEPLRLEVIALGSQTYRDVYEGDRWRSSNSLLDTSSLGILDDFLQLRTYHVDYRLTVLGKCDPVLTLMAKGCVRENPRYCDIEVLKPYWLG